MGLGLLEVVGEFLVLVSIFDRKFEFTFFGPQDDGLTFHAADHVEGRLGFAAQRQLQQVFLDAGFDGFAQLGGDLKVAVGRAKSFDTLVRPLVVIIFDPEADAFSGRVEALELGAGQELLPDAFPEALDFAQGHRVMRPGFEVVSPVLFHLGLEASGTAPVHVLPAVVGEHLFGWLVLGGSNAKYLQNIVGRVTAEQIGSDHEPGVIIHEADEVGVAAAQPEGEDIGLPHLVGRGPLEEPGSNEIAPRLGRGLDQTLLVQRLANRLRAARQEEHSPQELGYLFDPARRFLLFEFDNLVPDRLGQLPYGRSAFPVPKALFAELPIALQPFANGGDAQAHLLGDHLLREALLQVELDGAQPLLKGAGMSHNFLRSAPRGGGALPLLLYWFILLHADTFYH